MARGMVLGEALARCPELMLVPGDPVRGGGGLGGGDARAGVDRRGASSRPRPGLAYFEADGAARDPRHAGGDASRPPGGALAAPGAHRRCARRASARWPAALAVRSRRPLVLEGKEARRWLAGRPVELLGYRRGHRGADRAAHPPGRAHARRAGRGSGARRSADRFGAPGALAHGLACGEDSPLRPRRMEERLEESMEVGDASSGEALKRVLGVLVDRLLARAERRGRTLRAATLSARLLAGGGWRERVVFRQALADPERIWLALSVRLLRASRPGRRAGAGRRALRAARQRAGCAVRAADDCLTARGGLAPSSAAPRACARPSPRCAPWRDRTRRCAPCAWTPTRACPSGGWCWRRSLSDGSALLTRALNQPRPGARALGARACPAQVNGEAIESLRESWLVEDRWWTAEPLRRRYWELVGERGRNVVVFHDLCSRALVPAGMSRSRCSRVDPSVRRAALPLGLLVPGRRLAARGAGASGPASWAMWRWR